jgi:hypothetical protein
MSVVLSSYSAKEGVAEEKESEVGNSMKEHEKIMLQNPVMLHFYHICP